MQRLLLLAFFLALAAGAACSSSSDSGGIQTGSKDAGTSVEVDARNPYPSFRDDVVPIIQESCALTSCHASKTSNLGIFLSDDKTQLFSELQKTSPTSMKPFVVAGDPTNSYVMVKLENRQASLTASCTNMMCGTQMPPDAQLSSDKLDTVRKWIMAGAKDD